MYDWQFIDNAMTYLSYATGYKSGGYDGQVFSAYVTGPFEPEEMTSIEWGVKGDFFEDVLRVEGSLFNQELDGQQTSAETKQCTAGSTKEQCNEQDPTAAAHHHQPGCDYQRRRNRCAVACPRQSAADRVDDGP